MKALTAPIAVPRGVTTMRTLDGRTYRVVNAALGRTMARDLQRMAAAYGHLLVEVQRRILDQGLPIDVRTPFGAWQATLQVHTGQVMQAAGYFSRLYGVEYIPGQGGVTVPDGRFDNRRQRAVDAEGLQALGVLIAEDARDALRSVPVSARIDVPPTTLPPAGSALTRGAVRALAPLPVAATATIYAVGVVTAGVVIYQLGRTALTWYAPEGRATYEAFAAGRDALLDAYERDLEQCDDAGDPSGCRAQATERFVGALDTIARSAGKASWQSVALRVGLLGAGAYLLAKVLS